MLPLDKLTPEQKIGRILCSRNFNSKDNMDFTLELIKNQACGCLQMSYNELTDERIRKFREAADYPILIVNDMETGFPMSTLPKVPMVTLAACDNSEYTRAFGAALAIPGKVEALVHFGNPLAVSKINGIPLKMYGYTVPEAQRFAIDALAGVIPAKGKMPFPRLMNLK